MANYDDLKPWKQRRYNKLVAKRDKAEKGSAKWNRMQNRINRVSGVRGKMRNPFKGEANTAYSKSGDTAKFDVSNEFDVIKAQKMLFPNNPEEWDGMFGPKTAKAWQNHVNANRTSSGQTPYTYGNDAKADHTSTQDKTYGPLSLLDSDAGRLLMPGLHYGMKGAEYLADTKLGQKLGDAGNEIMDIPSNIGNVLSESRESGTLNNIGGKLADRFSKVGSALWDMPGNVYAGLFGDDEIEDTSEINNELFTKAMDNSK